MNNELVKDLKEWVVIYSSSHPLTEQMVKEFNEILSSHEHDEENENGDTITMRQSDLRYFQEHKAEFIKWREGKGSKK